MVRVANIKDSAHNKWYILLISCILFRDLFSLFLFVLFELFVISPYPHQIKVLSAYFMQPFMTLMYSMICDEYKYTRKITYSNKTYKCMYVVC